MNRKLWGALIIITCIAALLRLWSLGSVPPSPDWDEAALGYNALSILNTGRDEYGEWFPLILRSFDDYKPALYTYFIIPLIPLLGLNIVVVRLPSALFGILAVFSSFFLVRELFFFYRQDKKNQNSINILALSTAFFLAISPWNIQFSRIAFESNVAVTINILAVLFFLKGLRKNIYLLLSAFLFTANLYMYQSEKVFIPLLIFVICGVFYKEILKINKKYIFLTVAVAIVVVAPLVFYTISHKEVFARAQGVSIFADKTQLLQKNTLRLLKDREQNDFVGMLLDNRRVLYLQTIIAGYIAHYDLNWLFVTGDIDRHHAPSMGLLYLFELPLLLIGIYMIIFGKFERKTKLLICLWVLIAPIPASVTNGVPHAIRVMNVIPMLDLFIGLGFITLVTCISNVKYTIVKMPVKYIFFIVCILFALFNFLYYLNQYFVQQPYYYSQAWQYGYKQAVETVKKIENKYSKIVVSNQGHLDQSYMFFLFYLQYPPALYQKDSQNASGGFRENHAFGKYEFRPITWDTENKDGSVLFIGRPSDFLEASHTIKSINFLNGEEAIRIVD